MRTDEDREPPPPVDSTHVVPYAARNPPMLVGGALCRAEPTFTGGWRDPRVKPTVSRPPGARRLTKWPVACAILDTPLGENTPGARQS